MLTKQQRNELKAKGVTILRAQWNHRKQHWQIAKNTDKGGWEVVSNEQFATQPEAIAKIDWMVEQFPDVCCKDQ